MADQVGHDGGDARSEPGMTVVAGDDGGEMADQVGHDEKSGRE